MNILCLFILVITTLITVRSLPICDTSMEAPPIFIKPLILPPSYSRSTLSPELLKILGHSQSNPESPSSPSPSNSLLATDDLSLVSPVPSSTIFDQFSTLYTAPSEFPTARPSTSKLSTVESNSNSFGTSVIPTTTTSDQIPTHKNNDHNTAPASVISSPEQFPNAFLLSAASFPPTTISAETSPTNNVPVVTNPPDPHPALVSDTTSSLSPFHGSTLLPIKPLILSSKYNQELQKFLSNFTAATTSSQNLDQIPQHSPILTSSSDTLPETSPTQLSSAQPDLTSKVSQTPAPLPAPIQSPNSVLNHLLNSRLTINQLNSLLKYSSPNSNFNPLPTVGPQLSSTYKSSLNRTFIKYLLTLPCFRRSFN